MEIGTKIRLSPIISLLLIVSLSLRSSRKTKIIKADEEAM